MSRRNKLLKFTEILTFPNVYESFTYDSPVLSGENAAQVELAGLWNFKHFKNDNPITVELACGRGEYCIGLAHRYPERNFIGVDVKGARIWRGARNSLDQGLNNVAFLRCKIEALELFFEPEEIKDIWLTFPDPFLKDSKSNRRLTSQNFLSTYSKLLSADQTIHLKTDSKEFYDHTKMVIAENKHEVLVDSEDIYSGELPHPDLDILTFYERLHLKDNRTIRYLKFKLT